MALPQISDYHYLNLSSAIAMDNVTGIYARTHKPPSQFLPIKMGSHNDIHWVTHVTCNVTMCVYGGGGGGSERANSILVS